MGQQARQLITVAIMVGLAGCSSTPAPDDAGAPQENVFVAVVDTAVVGPAYRDGALAAIGQRRQVFVGPVRVEASDEDAFDGLEAGEIEAYASDFRTALLDALPPDVVVVERPEDARLIVAPVLTDIDTSLGAVAAATTFLPQGLLISMGSRAVTGEHLGVGGASMRLDLIDAETGAPILSVSDEARASKTSFGRITDPSDDPREVFGLWAAWLASAFA